MSAVFLPPTIGGYVVSSMKSKADLAERLKGYIARSPKTQRQIAEEIGVEESYLSKLANGATNWTTGKYFSPLVRALGLREAEVIELKPDAIVYIAPEPRLPPSGDTEMSIKVEHLGGVTTGRLGIASSVYQTIPDDLAGGFNPADLYTLKVTRDILLESPLRSALPAPSTIIFHRYLTPSVARPVINVWLPDTGMGVLKVWRPDERPVVLEAHDDSGATLLIQETTPQRVQGVMIGYWAPTLN